MVLTGKKAGGFSASAASVCPVLHHLRNAGQKKKCSCKQSKQLATAWVRMQLSGNMDWTWNVCDMCVWNIHLTCFNCLVWKEIIWFIFVWKICFVDPICILSFQGYHVFKFWNTAVQVICSRPGVHLSSGNKAHMDFLSCHIMLHYWGFNVIGWLMVWWDIFCSGSCNRVQADSGCEE